MVPGSTFRYGSSFCIVTRSPRATSRLPREEAVNPLPSEEATPPVTKMCLVSLPFPTEFHHRAPDAAVANRRAGVSQSEPAPELSAGPRRPTPSSRRTPISPHLTDRAEHRYRDRAGMTNPRAGGAEMWKPSQSGPSTGGSHTNQAGGGGGFPPQ